MDPKQAQAASIRRRLRFSDGFLYQLDRIRAIRNARRGRFLRRIYAAGRLLYDYQERLRLSGLVPHPGKPHIAALHADMRVPQDPRYLNYWYDAQRHALVGMHLGLDLIRHDGRFHVVECNFSASLSPGRRALYSAAIDPQWAALIDFARAHGFQRIVLCRRQWGAWTIEELKQASRQSGIELEAVTVPAAIGKRGAEFPVVNPLYALPRPLAERTMYVILSWMSESPLIWFMHNKAWTGRWLPEALAAHPSESGLLAHIPTYDRLIVPELLPDPRWPNLVVKLTELDMTLGVAMGRFASEADARQALQLDDRPDAVPGIFGDRGRGMTAIYQPFIPPEVVNGRALKIRMLTFLSPLGDAFLSAHAVHAALGLPESLSMGLIPDPKAYAVSHAGGGHYERADAALEEQLRTVAEEFGSLARFAIHRRFEVGDAPACRGAEASVPQAQPESRLPVESPVS